MTGDAMDTLVRRMHRAGSGPVCAYVYDLGELRRATAALVASLPARCRLFYATKANSDSRLLEALRPVVHGFEVASIGEIETVRALAPQAPIAFGGPGKTDRELRGALDASVRYIHVESAHELRRLALLAEGRSVPVDVLLRVNLRGPLPAATLSMSGVPTQFGIEEGAVPAVLALARSLPSVRVRGFHFHSISNHLDARRHVELVGLYLEKASAWSRAMGTPLEVLNVGGGVGIDYADTARSFEWPVLVEGLGALLAGFPELRELVLECGRFIAARCGSYATEVLDVKTTHGETFVVVRGGTHHFRLPASWGHSHPFRVVPIEAWPYPFSRPAAADAPVTVVGQLCTPKDVLARRVRIDRVRAGDVLLFSHAGAYGWSISHHDFLSHPHPERVYVDADVHA